MLHEIGLSLRPGHFEETLASLLNQHKALRAEVARLQEENVRARNVAAARAAPPLNGLGELSKKPPIPKLPASWVEDLPSESPHASMLNTQCEESLLRSAAQPRARSADDKLHVSLARPGPITLPNSVESPGPPSDQATTNLRNPSSRGVLKAMISEAETNDYDIEKRHLKAERRRLRELIGTFGETDVTDKQLLAALKPRVLDEELSLDRVQRAMVGMCELAKIPMTLPNTQMPEPSPATGRRPSGRRGLGNSQDHTIPLDVLTRHVMDKTLPGKEDVYADDLEVVLGGLRMLCVDDLVEDVTRGQIEGPRLDLVRRGASYMQIFDSIVSTTIIVNLVCMGFEMDHVPNSLLWFVVEAVCVSIYISEVFLKVGSNGLRHHVTGPAWQWNCLDFFITFVAAADIPFACWRRFSTGTDSSNATKVASVVQVAILMRVLRVVRVVRMARLVRSAWFTDLANMLVGFVIGLPALLWVLVAFVVILYMVGLVFRMMFGPIYGEEYMPSCGWGDDLVDIKSTECPIHYLYGEEFFGSVTTAMFTSFRFMLGDYSTRAGKSIVVALSAGYGFSFDTMFVGWMIIVIFGIFNIITAIFVDSTISGLKHNDIKRKYARQYERRYVQAKLKAVLERVYHLFRCLPASSSEDAEPDQKPWMKTYDLRNTEMEVEQFVAIMSDPTVKDLMLDIDIDFRQPAAMFDAFDGNGSRSVSMEELAAACLKLRGEPQKHDIVCSAVSLKALHDKFDLFEVSLAHRKCNDLQ